MSNEYALYLWCIEELKIDESIFTPTKIRKEGVVSLTEQAKKDKAIHFEKIYNPTTFIETDSSTVHVQNNYLLLKYTYFLRISLSFNCLFLR